MMFSGRNDGQRFSCRAGWGTDRLEHTPTDIATYNAASRPASARMLRPNEAHSTGYQDGLRDL
jgi:hypothetical protein